MRDLIANLNPPQQEAVTYLGGPLMIIAGAGSGKTRVITYRIAFLHREVGIPLGDILAVTFTNKAAREMRERVHRILGLAGNTLLPIGTFHARCAMILRRDAAAAGLDRNFLILDEGDQLQAVKQAMARLDISEKLVKPSQVHQFIQIAKMKLLEPKDTEEEFADERIPYPSLYALYEEILQKNKSLDIEDLIFRTVRLFQSNDEVRQSWARRFQYLLVDEYQDTNHGQFLLTKLLAQDHNNIAVVGDEDQAIYSWRGADITNLLDFSKSFPDTKIVRLEQNYRSTGLILRAASGVIAHNTQRLGKTLFTDLGDGLPLEYRKGEDDRHEGMLVAGDIERLLQSGEFSPTDIAVFYRSHRLSRPVEDALRAMRIPYKIIGGIKFYDRAEIKDVLGFVRLAVNPADDLAFERVMNVPKRGAGDKALSVVQELALKRGLPLVDAAWAAVRENLIGAKARAGLLGFLTAIDGWIADAPSLTASAMLERVMIDTRYREEAIGDVKSIDGAARMENIGELMRVAKEFEANEEAHGPGDFLRTLSLDSTTAAEDEEAAVSLLSIHNAKGLEYRVVFIIGLDEGVFPNSRALDGFSETGLEEERRLMYVALTRARERLHLSRASRRLSYGSGYIPTEPSRFLSELQPDVLSSASVRLLKRELPYSWGAEGEKGGPAPRLFASRAPATTPASGVHIDFKRGMRVVHRYLGAGEVSQVSGRVGSQRIEVIFDSGREQSFVARQAPITLEATD